MHDVRPRWAPGLWRWAASLGLLAAGCGAAKLTPTQQELVAKGDCAALLKEADQARAQKYSNLARTLALGCSQSGLLALVQASSPAEGLLWCGRARAALGKRGEPPSCDVKLISGLRESLKPKLTLGPPDESMKGDARLRTALLATESELNLSWDPLPDVVVGRLFFELELQDSSTLAPVKDGDGKKRRVPATAHRKVAHCQAEVGLGGRTRTLRATAEARDLTWEAVPKHGVAGKTEAVLPSDDDLKQQAAVAFLKVLAKALAVAPPETIDLLEAKGCVAYGLALNATSGDPEAAAKGAGDADSVEACEGLLGMPRGAGIPVP